MLELVQSFGTCLFIKDGVGLEKKVIIGPITIHEEFKDNGDRKYDLVIGCNRYRYCEDEGCAYSRVSRLARKKITEQVTR